MLWLLVCLRLLGLFEEERVDEVWEEKNEKYAYMMFTNWIGFWL